MKAKFTAVDAAQFLGVTVQSIHKQLKSKNLDFKKTQNRVYFGHITSKELLKLKFHPQTIAFQIVKGGTGKTSLVHSTAVRANLYGAKVLCIDLDQQGNLTQSFQVNAEELPVLVDVLQEQASIEETVVNISEGLDLIPSRIENAIVDNILIMKQYPLDKIYKNYLTKLRKNYDLIIIDCPPALGQSVAAVALAADLVIAPVTPEEFSLSGLKISFQEIANLEKNFEKKIPFKLLLNKFDSRTSLSHEILSTLIKHQIYGDRLFKTYVRVSQEFPNSISKGDTVFDHLKSSTAKEDIDLLTKEILNINTQGEQNDISLGKLEEIKS